MMLTVENVPAIVVEPQVRAPETTLHGPFEVLSWSDEPDPLTTYPVARYESQCSARRRPIVGQDAYLHRIRQSSICRC